MPDDSSVHVRIAGRVQGVSFRAWTAERAARLGLSGWVRNLRSGDVEAVFCGETEAVKTMLKACRDGPRYAEVVEVVIVGPGEIVTGGFTIIDTV